MRRVRLALGALLLWTVPAAAATPSVLDGAAVTADRSAVERALAVEGLERAPSPPEASYGRDLGLALRRAVTRLFARGSLLEAPRLVLLGVVVLAGTAALLALLFKVVLPWWRGRRERGQKTAEGAGETVPAALPPVASERDAAAWQAELDRCLADGRVAEGLQAAWWWLARSVAGARAEPTWTGRDLLSRTRRHDLRELVRRLDTLLYGPERPDLDELRRLAGRMEETLS